jgi:hypothetical protein
VKQNVRRLQALANRFYAKLANHAHKVAKAALSDGVLDAVTVAVLAGRACGIATDDL